MVVAGLGCARRASAFELVLSSLSKPNVERHMPSGEKESDKSRLLAGPINNLRVTTHVAESMMLTVASPPHATIESSGLKAMLQFIRLPSKAAAPVPTLNRSG